MLDLASYGKEKRPVVVVWDSAELHSCEFVLLEEIREIVGYLQIEQFASLTIADRYLQRHKGLRHLNPTLVVVYNPCKESEIERFFDSYPQSKKLLVVVSDQCRLPQSMTNHDDYLVLHRSCKDGKFTDFAEEQLEVRNFLRSFLGGPLSHKLDPEILVSQYSPVV